VLKGKTPRRVNPSFRTPGVIEPVSLPGLTFAGFPSAETETRAGFDLHQGSAQAGWRPFSPPDKAFTVELPSEPQHDSDDPLSDAALTGETYTAMDVSTGLSFYTINILCTERLKAKGVEPNSLLDGLVEMMAGAPHKLVSKSRVEVDGLPGREFVYANERGNDYSKGRLINADSRVYMLMIVADNVEALSDAGVKRFLNSFHVNRPPNPLSHLPGCAGNEARLPRVLKGVAGIVRFPESWIESERGSERTLLTPQWYEVRARQNAPELLFAGMTAKGYWGEIYSERSREKPDDSWYALNFYAVNPADLSSVRSATKEEWRRATRISGRPKRLFPHAQDDSKSEVFEYKGHAYGKASEHWGSVLLSPGGRWLAVYSYSGQNTPVFLFGGGVPREGDIFWDVYDAKTGEKVLSWNARSVRNPALLDGGAVWAGENYLIMPFDMHLQTCVLGVLAGHAQ
jgi:hypothetical protein